MLLTGLTGAVRMSPTSAVALQNDKKQCWGHRGNSKATQLWRGLSATQLQSLAEGREGQPTVSMGTPFCKCQKLSL